MTLCVCQFVGVWWKTVTCSGSSQLLSHQGFLDPRTPCLAISNCKYFFLLHAFLFLFSVKSSSLDVSAAAGFKSTPAFEEISKQIEKVTHAYIIWGQLPKIPIYVYRMVEQQQKSSMAFLLSKSQMALVGKRLYGLSMEKAKKEHWSLTLPVSLVIFDVACRYSIVVECHFIDLWAMGSNLNQVNPNSWLVKSSSCSWYCKACTHGMRMH